MIQPVEQLWTGAYSQKDVILNNLHKDVTKEDIVDHIRKHGKIETPPKRISLEFDKEHDHGVAKIEFGSDEDAIQTIKKLNISKLKGREISAFWNIKGRPKKKLFKNKKRFKIDEKRGKSKFKRKSKLVIKNAGWSKP